MANDSITFFCPACSIKLTVPGSLAGVIGPCPSCRNQIQAPYPPPAYQPPPAPSYQATAPPPAPSASLPAAAVIPSYQPAPASQPSPGHQPTPTSQSYPAPIPVVVATAAPLPAAAVPAAMPPAAPTAAAAPAQQAGPAATAPPQGTTAAAPIQLPVSSLATGSPAVLRPEPRQLPNRTGTSEPIAKPMPEVNRTIDSSKAVMGRPAHSRSQRRLIRLLIPLICILVLAALVFGLLSLLLHPKKPVPPPDPAARPKQVKILPDETYPPVPAGRSGSEPAPSIPVSRPELPTIAQPPPELPSGLEPLDNQKAAQDVLEKFLTAKSLGERLPLIETKTTEPELAKSCLSAALPASSNIVPEFRETNTVEQVIDFYYSVDFDAGSNRLAPYTILVRKRGNSDPKIVADPFLDSYGGRLASYAKTPSEKAGIFQVIIYAVASCSDENVPNREKKLTLKMLPKEDSKELARAYFGRQSRIGRMLEDGTYSISFGKARPCTVMLRWNTEDRPDTPYLEAIDLKTLDWNP